MFPTHSPEQVAIASQLLKELSDYEEGLHLLLQRRWDPDLYRTLSDRFDRMQMQASSLPALGASWTELLITRVELAHALWTVKAPGRSGGRVDDCQDRHAGVIAEVRRKCLAYLDRGR